MERKCHLLSLWLLLADVTCRWAWFIIYVCRTEFRCEWLTCCAACMNRVVVAAMMRRRDLTVCVSVVGSEMWMLVLACTLPLPAGYFMPVFVYGEWERKRTWASLFCRMPEWHQSKCDYQDVFYHTVMGTLGHWRSVFQGQLWADCLEKG